MIDSLMEVRHDDHDKNDELTCFTDSGVAYIYMPSVTYSCIYVSNL